MRTRYNDGNELVSEVEIQVKFHRAAPGLSFPPTFNVPLERLLHVPLRVRSHERINAVQ